MIQPGGSLKDDVVFQAANEHNIAMVLTGCGTSNIRPKEDK